MAASLSWRSLLPGLIAIAILAFIVVALLARGGVGRVGGDTTRLYVATTQARGVMKGSEVWLAGQRVGVVDGVGFREPGSDTLARVVIAIDVRSDDVAQIRRDSEIRVRAGATLVGPIVVYITAGTPASQPVTEGDTLWATGQSDVAQVGERLDEAAANLEPLMQDVQAIKQRMRGSGGTLGAALADHERGRGAFTQLSRLSGRVSALQASFGGTSYAGLMGPARSAMARVDSIRVLLASPGSSFGRFRRDTTLVTAIASVRNELASARARLDSAEGTLYRFQRDSAIAVSLAAAQHEMALLLEDIRRRPLRYIAF